MWLLSVTRRWFVALLLLAASAGALPEPVNKNETAGS
jgi:hypothetical protein